MKVRKSIVHAFEAQEVAYVEIGAALHASQSSVVRVLRRHRERGNVDPLPRGGGNISSDPR